MFSEIPILGTKPRPIPLATRLGTPIDNEPGVALNDDAREKNARILQHFTQNWIPRTGMHISGYNCAGHVWASRRAAVYEFGQLPTILNDDGYCKLQDLEKPLPGDLALYRHPDDKIIHVGEVLRTEGDRPFTAIILSKWDDTSGEYMHSAWDVPFRRHFPDCKLEYWTERLRKFL